MKRALFFLACACSTPPRSVEIAAPLVASAKIAPAHDDDDVVLPRAAKPVAFGAEAPWAAGFPKAKTFAVYDAGSGNRVLLTWRIGKYRVANVVPPEEDYPGNHVAPIELGIRARSTTTAVAFGELGGSVRPTSLAFCAPSDHETTHSAFAAAFSIGTMQGDDEMVVVRDGPTLHVLHRETSDGSCEEAKQGPLDICEGFEWQLAADVRVSRGAAVWEMVEAEGKPFDCNAE